MMKDRKRAVMIGLAVTGVLTISAVGALAMEDATPMDAVPPQATTQPLLSCAVEEYLQDIPLVVQRVKTPEPVENLIALGEFKITHYCACTKCCGKSEDDPAYGITATGTVATEGRTIAVDPRVIPYGTEIVVRYADGTEVRLIAEDCGGAIKGNRLDIYMESHEAALVEGVKTAEVYIAGGTK